MRTINDLVRQYADAYHKAEENECDEEVSAEFRTEADGLLAEIDRRVDVLKAGDVKPVGDGKRPHLAKFAIEAFHAARQAMPADQVTVDVIVRGMDAVTDCRLDRIYGDGMIRTAAQWALTQQPAADMPPGSVVAQFASVAYTKRADGLWPVTGGVGAVTSEGIDQLIADGHAEVLRVGTGRDASLTTLKSA